MSGSSSCYCLPFIDLWPSALQKHQASEQSTATLLIVRFSLLKDSSYCRATGTLFGAADCFVQRFMNLTSCEAHHRHQLFSGIKQLCQRGPHPAITVIRLVWCMSLIIYFGPQRILKNRDCLDSKKKKRKRILENIDLFMCLKLTFMLF